MTVEEMSQQLISVKPLRRVLAPTDRLWKFDSLSPNHHLRFATFIQRGVERSNSKCVQKVEIATGHRGTVFAPKISLARLTTNPLSLCPRRFRLFQFSDKVWRLLEHFEFEPIRDVRRYSSSREGRNLSLPGATNHECYADIV